MFYCSWYNGLNDPSIFSKSIHTFGLKGKNKLADKWKKDFHLVVEQPNIEVPVYVVKREHVIGMRKLFHGNLLHPFMALTASKQNPFNARRHLRF